MYIVNEIDTTGTVESDCAGRYAPSLEKGLLEFIAHAEIRAQNHVCEVVDFFLQVVSADRKTEGQCQRRGHRSLLSVAVCEGHGCHAECMQHPALMIVLHENCERVLEPVIAMGLASVEQCPLTVLWSAKEH